MGSKDNELVHHAEDVGYLAMSIGSILGDDQDGNEPPQFIYGPGYNPGHAGLPGYYSTDTPELWAALAEMEARGDEIVGDFVTPAQFDLSQTEISDGPCCTSGDLMNSILSELELENFIPQKENLEDSEPIIQSSLGTSQAIGNLAGAVELQEPITTTFFATDMEVNSSTSMGEEASEMDPLAL